LALYTLLVTNGFTVATNTGVPTLYALGLPEGALPGEAPLPPPPPAHADNISVAKQAIIVVLHFIRIPILIDNITIITV
jgi:hypothetical protein